MLSKSEKKRQKLNMEKTYWEWWFKHILEGLGCLLACISGAKLMQLKFGCQVGRKTAFVGHFGRQEAAKGSQNGAKLAPKGSQDEPKWQQKGMPSSKLK